MNNINYDYYHTNESELFLFYRIPKVLFTDNKYKNLSTDAKVLYGLMLDRMGLSIKNNWCDNMSRVYIIYTQEEVIEQLNYKKEKVVKLYKELDDIGLIERKKHGQGRPTWIYVKKFILSSENKEDDPNSPPPDFGDSETKTSEKQTSRSSDIGNQDFRKSNCSNIDLNNTEFNYTDINHINQPENEIQTHDDRYVIDKMDSYRQIIQGNIEYDILIQNHKKDFIDEIVELIVENVCFSKKSYYINNNDYPAEIVKSRFMKLDAWESEYQRFHNSDSHVMNADPSDIDSTAVMEKYLPYLKVSAMFDDRSTLERFVDSQVSLHSHDHRDLQYAYTEIPDFKATILQRMQTAEETPTSAVSPANFHITDDNLGQVNPRRAGNGAKTKYQMNVDAIKTLKQIESENRFATPEEQETLSKYVGWGGIPQAFDDRNPQWSNEYTELKDLLTDSE